MGVLKAGLLLRVLLLVLVAQLGRRCAAEDAEEELPSSKTREEDAKDKNCESHFKDKCNTVKPPYNFKDYDGFMGCWALKSCRWTGSLGRTGTFEDCTFYQPCWTRTRFGAVFNCSELMESGGRFVCEYLNTNASLHCTNNCTKHANVVKAKTGDIAACMKAAKGCFRIPQTTTTTTTTTTTSTTTTTTTIAGKGKQPTGKGVSGAGQDSTANANKGDSTGSKGTPAENKPNGKDKDKDKTEKAGNGAEAMASLWDGLLHCAILLLPLARLRP